MEAKDAVAAKSLHEPSSRPVYWAIKRSFLEYDDKTVQFITDDPFKDWLRSRWGVEVFDLNKWHYDYRVVDAKKFLLFMLKYDHGQ